MNVMYPAFTRMTGGVTTGNSGLCCCPPYLFSAINSLSLLAHNIAQLTCRLSLMATVQPLVVYHQLPLLHLLESPARTYLYAGILALEKKTNIVNSAVILVASKQYVYSEQRCHAHSSIMHTVCLRWAVGRSFGPVREGIRRSRPPRVSQLWVK